jgi:putative membrane protein
VKTFRLARFELRRFLRGRLPAAALAVLTVIPLLYGALYLYAFWDPYNNLDQIPVALVEEDQPAKSPDGRTVHAGADIADKLVQRRVFDWHRTDAGRAEAGLRSGRYHLMFRIPAGFSTALANGTDPTVPAKRAELRVVSDDATNYLSGLLARSAFTEIRAAAGESAASAYFNGMLIGFTDLKTKTGEAADGAGQLAAGAGQAQDGATGLAAGADRAHTGAGQLADGLGTASTGAEDLAAGLSELDRGAAQLADGTARAAAGGRQLATRVDAAADKVEPVLRDNAVLIQQSATTVAEGAQALADHLDTLVADAGTAVSRSEAVAGRLDKLVRAHPELADDPTVTAARKAAKEAVTAARAVRTGLDRADLTDLRTRMLAVAAAAREVAAAAPHLADDVATARAKVDQLATGLDQLASGAQRLHGGTRQAAAGAAQLSNGLYRLSTGARELDGGLGRLSAGGRRLAAGLTDLETGAGRLADGLSTGAEKIPGYDDPKARADVLGDPVSLDRTARHPAASYGVGFAPYFLALALYVGSMITYMLLRPLNRRHVMSGAPAWRVALAGWLPGLAVGLAQAVVLFAVVTLALDLDPVRPLPTLGLLMVAAAAFSAIIQFLGARLGPAGRLVALALLMLQLTSSGGTYPVQTSPGFFQAVHPFVPMTYVVDGLRHTVNGGGYGPVVTAALVLAGFAAGAVTLTVGAARRARLLTASKLHPELTM